ncbi:YbaB/EbfC family nucleoid-associated protein [Prauserella oleivorans]|uniref:YbaB/EbfC family nucleoid-associated protein n=1 Tax=Prauserella oleivorans TaxID=1478153 RepID=A0ABW5W238_9PSEU
MSAEFERLVAEFEKFKSKMKHVDTQLAGVSEMQNELGQLEATASNADRSITVTAGPGGTVKDIQLTDKALAQSPQALSAALMSTIQDAVAESARRQAAIVDSHMGGLGINITDQVIETQAELLGTSPAELRARMQDERPAARSVPVEEEYHDDYSHRNLLDDNDKSGRPTPPPPPSSGSAGDEFLKNLFDDDSR